MHFSVVGFIMSASKLPSSVESRLQELCAAIASAPEIVAARAKAEAFLSDESAVGLYRQVVSVGRDLEQRDRAGTPISGQEVEAFEALQEKADEHDAIRSFAEAQEIFRNVVDTVGAFVAKTIEKGAVPSADEMESACCGSGCGCH